MDSSIRDKIEGAFHEIKGKIKEMAGSLRDDPNLEAEGSNEKIAGRIQEKIGRYAGGRGGSGARSGKGADD